MKQKHDTQSWGILVLAYVQRGISWAINYCAKTAAAKNMWTITPEQLRRDKVTGNRNIMSSERSNEHVLL